MLLAYQDNALTDDEDRFVWSHLRICERCRERMAMSREIGVLLRRHVPMIDEPEGLAELKRRLREPPTPPRPFWNLFVLDRVVVLCISLVALLSIGLMTTQTIEGGSSFTRWFSDGGSTQRVFPDGRVGGTPVTASTIVAGTSTLPLGLMPVDGESNRAGDRFYRSSSGLSISVVIEQGDQSRIYVDDDTGMSEIVGVNGRDVYVLFGDTAAGRAVVIFYWVEKGQLVSVFVLRQPPGGLQVEHVSEIAVALMTQDDD